MAARRRQGGWGAALVAVVIAACSPRASFLSSFDFLRRPWVSTSRPLDGQATQLFHVGEQKRSRDLSRYCMSPGQFMRRIRSADTHHELFLLSESGEANMLHRAGILTRFAHLAVSSSQGDVGSSFALSGEQIDAFRGLLLMVMQDLSCWKSSGSIKGRTPNQVFFKDQAQYLGNMVWSLGRLRGAIAVALSENERVLLLEHETIAVLQALPDLVQSKRISEVAQILFGLRLSDRHLQIDAIFSTLAPSLPDLLRSSKQGYKTVADIVNAYSMYLMFDPAVVDMFVSLKSMILDTPIDNPQSAVYIARICKSYARYAVLCNRHADPGNSFSVFLDKRGIYNLGIAMKTRRGQPAIEIVEVAPGLVSRWNRVYPEWQIQKGDGITKANNVTANNVTNDALSVAAEIKRSDKVMLTIQRGKAILGVGARRPMNLTRGDLKSMVDKTMMQLAIKFVESCRNAYYDEAVLSTTLVNVLQGMTVLNVDCRPLYQYLAPKLKVMIPTLNSDKLISVLWSLSVKDVFDDDRTVQALADRALVLLQSNRITSRNSFFPAALKALKALHFKPTSEVLRQLRAAAKQDGITDQELDHPGDLTRFLLTGDEHVPAGRLQ